MGEGFGVGASIHLNHPTNPTKRSRRLTLRQRGSVENGVEVNQVDAFIGEVFAVAQDFQVVAVVEPVFHGLSRG